MFCGEVDEVTKTHILVAPICKSIVIKGTDRLNRERWFKKPVGSPLQLVIYSNVIRMKRNPVEFDGTVRTAMILPFPIIQGRRNRFKIFESNYHEIFDDADALFDTPGNDMRNPNGIGPDNLLPVQKIGSYKVTVCTGISDLDNVNSGVFSDYRTLREFAVKYYPKGFGFIICSLTEGAQYKPLMYCHELRSNGKLFVPIRRMMTELDQSSRVINRFDSDFGNFNDAAISDYYNDIIGNDDSTDDCSILKFHSELRNNITTPDAFDHTIYIINKKLTSDVYGSIKTLPQKRIDAIASYINISRMPKEITFGKITTMQQLYLGKTCNTKMSDIYI
jgi:hypothetical protein